MNKIKFIIAFISILIFQLSANAQTSEDIGKFMLGISYPDKANELTEYYFPKLESKISKALTSKGYTTFGDCRFICLPSINIDDVSKAEGGMKDVYSVTGNLEIIVLDNYNGTVFQTIDEPIKGHATTESKAISNAISAANLSGFSKLLPTIKEKISDYFRTNKNNMLIEAQHLAEMNSYDEAIAYLMTYPSEITPEYYEVLNFAGKIYDKKMAHERQLFMQKQMSENKTVLMRANNALQSNNPQEALRILWDFNPGYSDQDSQYENLVASANQLITTKERAEFEKAERAYRDERKDKDREFFLENKKIDTHQQIENKRIDAQKEVAHHSIEVRKEIANNSINAQKEVAHHYINASQDIESKKIDAMKQISVNILKAKKN